MRKKNTMYTQVNRYNQNVKKLYYGTERKTQKNLMICQFSNNNRNQQILYN